VRAIKYNEPGVFKWACAPRTAFTELLYSTALWTKWASNQSLIIIQRSFAPQRNTYIVMFFFYFAAIRGRVNEKKQKDDSLILKVTPIRSIKGSLKRARQVRLRIPVSESSTCGYVNKRKQFLIVGTKRGRRMIVTFLMRWKDFRKLGRKLREKACRKI
jgi:hypothetical protein